MEPVLVAVRREMAVAVVGQQGLVDELCIVIVCGAHCQIEGTAGVGKWLAVEALAQCLGLTAAKLRCSPDLAPDDLVELMSLPEDARDRSSDPGSFANVLLADNYPRLSPRLHNLMQQAAQERALDIRGRRWELPDPFALIATRYPADEPDEATWEIHDDRFLFRIGVAYAPYHEEYEMAETTTQPPQAAIRPVLSRAELMALRQRVLSARAPAPVIHYAVRLVRATRVHQGENPDFIYEWVQQGAGPRAVRGLVLAAKARAVLHGRDEATQDDVRAVIYPALRHRIRTNRNARSNGITTDRIIERLLQEIPPRVVGDDVPPRSGQSLTLHDWVPIDGQA